MSVALPLVVGGGVDPEELPDPEDPLVPEELPLLDVVVVDPDEPPVLDVVVDPDEPPLLGGGVALEVVPDELLDGAELDPELPVALD